jgi:hypothetical protein
MQLGLGNPIGTYTNGQWASFEIAIQLGFPGVTLVYITGHL